MAAPQPTKPTSQAAPKIVDIINKHSQAASSTSRPLINNKQPQDDPMVVKQKSTPAPTPPAESAQASATAPAAETSASPHKLAYSSGSTPSSDTGDSADTAADPSLESKPTTESTDAKANPEPSRHGLKIEPIDPHRVGEVFGPDDDKNQPSESSQSDKPAAKELAKDDSKPDTSNNSPATDTSGTTSTKTSAASDDSSGNQSEISDITETSVSESTDSSDNNEPKAGTTKDKAAEPEPVEELDPIDLLSDQSHRDHGSLVALLIGLIVIIILGAAAIDLALDAGLIQLATPHTHFFNS